MQATAAFVPVFHGGDMAVSCDTGVHGRMALAWRGLLGSRTPVLDGSCDATDADQEYPSSQGAAYTGSSAGNVQFKDARAAGLRV